MYYFVILLIVILVVIYIYGFITKNEKFVSGYDSSDMLNEPINYITRKQNCDELTYSPTECIVDTVVPSNKIVCTKSMSPISNNEIDSIEKEKKEKKSKNPTISLSYDFDLLSSFNNAQIENNTDDEIKSLDDLKTDVKSFNSLENDIMSNY